MENNTSQKIYTELNGKLLERLKYDRIVCCDLEDNSKKELGDSLLQDALSAILKNNPKEGRLMVGRYDDGSFFITFFTGEIKSVDQCIEKFK